MTCEEGSCERGASLADGLSGVKKLQEVESSDGVAMVSISGLKASAKSYHMKIDGYGHYSRNKRRGDCR